MSHPSPRREDAERFLYTGKELDSESHLMYYGARYYNPEIMRFVQPDSIIQNIYNPQALNRYSYVVNNPYKYVDPTGHIFQFLPLWAISIIVGIVADYSEDLPWLAYAAYEYAKNPSEESWGYLAVTGVIAAKPNSIGEQEGLREARIAQNELKAVKTVEKTESLIKNIQQVDQTIQSIPKVPEWKGPKINYVDLPKEAQGTLEALKNKGPFKYMENTKTWENRKSQLPPNPEKYYTEVTIATPGQNGRGLQRFVIGGNSEAYYTNNHYRSFSLIYGYNYNLDLNYCKKP